MYKAKTIENYINLVTNVTKKYRKFLIFIVI